MPSIASNDVNDGHRYPVDWHHAEPGFPQAVTVTNHFGTWEAALQAADET